VPSNSSARCSRWKTPKSLWHTADRTRRRCRARRGSPARLPCRHSRSRSRPGCAAGELHRVAQQVGQGQLEHRGVGLHGGKGGMVQTMFRSRVTGSKSPSVSCTRESRLTIVSLMSPGPCGKTPAGRRSARHLPAGVLNGLHIAPASLRKLASDLTREHVHVTCTCSNGACKSCETV